MVKFAVSGCNIQPLDNAQMLLVKVRCGSTDMILSFIKVFQHLIKSCAVSGMIMRMKLPVIHEIRLGCTEHGIISKIPVHCCFLDLFETHALL